MRLIATTAFAIALALAGCKGSTPVAGAALNPQAAACNTACDKAKDECIDKCANELEANRDACKLACTAAQDKCASDCKSQ